jgi:hypothetical protein
MRTFVLLMLLVNRTRFNLVVIDGNKVKVKITEYGPDLLRPIRRGSGFNDDFLIK